jgi:outer membrane protein assembly factor BamB
MTGIPTGVTEYICLDAYTGNPIWKDDVYITSSGATNDPAVLAFGNLYCIPSANNNVTVSNQIWCYGASKDWSMFLHDAAHTSIGQSGPSNLYVQWTFETDGPLIGSPVIANGKLYEGSQDGYLYCVNATTGAFLWKFKINDMMRSTPAVVNGKVYIGPDDGNVYCLDADTGQKLWDYYAG